MAKIKHVVIDTNVLSLARKIDADCGIVGLIVDVYGDVGIADYPQLLKMDYCQGVRNLLSHHDIGDDQVADFLLNYDGSVNLNRIKNDPADLKLIIFAINNPGSFFLTCETGLLALAEDRQVGHACFKAAAHRLDSSSGGLFCDSAYNTSGMFDPNGGHPFFHYGNNARCQQCDKTGKCETKNKPPKYG